MPSVPGFVGGIGRVRLSLDLTGNPTPTGGEILAVATLVTEQNSEPVNGQSLEFYLGADRITDVVTGDDGRATHTFHDLGFGTHAVSVRIAGVYVTQRVTFVQPKPKTPDEEALARLQHELEIAKLQRNIAEATARPDPDRANAERRAALARSNFEAAKAEADTAKLTIPASKKLQLPVIRAEGGEGLYKISLTAAWDDGSPAANVPFRVIKSEQGCRPDARDQSTDASGYGLYELNFDAAECDVIVQILGFEKELKNLRGPAKHPRPPRVPDFSEAEVAAIEGLPWLERTRHAWRAGGEELRKQRRRNP